MPSPVGFYATHVEPYRIRVDRLAISIDPARVGNDPVRIGVLSDLQTNDITGYERSVVDLLLAEEPDLILLPGDLFQGNATEFAEHEAELGNLLGELHAPGGVYFVRGDVDVDDYADRALAGTDIVLLDDELAG